MPETDLHPLFDYEALAPAVREMVQEHTGEIRTLARRAAQDIVEIGERLIQVKEALGHGQFGIWLDAEFGWAERSARRFMEVASAFKTANLADLNIAPSALYALASGSTPSVIREEFVQRAEAGEPITNKAVAERLEQHRQQFQPEPEPPVIVASSSPPIVETPAPEPDTVPEPVRPLVVAAPALPTAKRSFMPLPREVEDLELQDGRVVQVPSLPLLPRERELKERDMYKAACRFDSAASKVLAALTALDVYSMDEVEDIARSPEGRQLYAPVRVARIREMLEQLYEKWGVEEARTIDAEPLIGPKSLDALN